MKPITCAKCNQEIPEGDLVECPYCWEAYHTECWLETANCINCKKFNMDFARARAEKERAEAEAQALAEKESANSEFSELESDEDAPVEISNYSMADTVASVSKIVLIVSIVFGILFAVYMFASVGITGLIIGAVAGVGIAVCGWIISVLVNGFAELINNSRKTVDYLAKLTTKNDGEEK